MLRHNDYINILKELKIYSIVINYLYELKKITKDDIRDVLYQDNIEKSTLFYMKLIERINSKDQNKAIELVKDEIPRSLVLKDIVKKTKNTYSHLETMTTLSLSESEASKIINDSNYIEYIRLEKIEHLLDIIKDSSNLNRIESNNMYYEQLEKLKNRNLSEIEKNINNYYMQKIVH